MTVSLFADVFDKKVQEFFEALPEKAEKAMSLALNQEVGRDGFSGIKRQMRKEIDFPAGYLESGDRIDVAQKANPSNLKVVISARDRATSLARFTNGATPKNTPRGRPIRVTVRKGQSRDLKHAFLVSLKKGQSGTGNIGLAVRTKGGPPKKAYAPKEIFPNVYLLYGPSVDQVFSGVADKQKDQIATNVGTQFLRQVLRGK